jgi:ketosteroid isomerase-like protein
VGFVRGMVRVTTTIIALAGVLTLGLQPVPSAPVPGGTQKADLRPAAAVLAFFDALNRGDGAGAAATFADNGVFIGAAPRGLCSVQAPCFGPAKIREDMDVLFKAGHLCETVTSIQVNGSIVTGRVEGRNDGLRANGIERNVLSFMAQVLNDKIVLDVHRMDLADPETARNAAIAAGTQPKGVPITIVPPCP